MMIRYVVPDQTQNGQYVIISTSQGMPKNVLCAAPNGYDMDDLDLVETINPINGKVICICAIPKKNL